MSGANSGLLFFSYPIYPGVEIKKSGVTSAFFRWMPKDGYQLTRTAFQSSQESPEASNPRKFTRKRSLRAPLFFSYPTKNNCYPNVTPPQTPKNESEKARSYAIF